MTRFRRNRPPIVTGPDIEAERARLTAEMGDLRADLVSALVHEADDPVLSAKYAAATSAGMPTPDLTGVPQFRRLQVIDEACDAWAETTAGGPCDYCGSRKPRYAPGQMDEPRFTTVGGSRRACNWCADAIAADGPDHLRERIGHAATATFGFPPGGALYRFSSPELVPFAFEVPDAGNGLPWSHITSDAHRMARLRRQALAKVPPQRFCRTKGQCDSVAVPGVVTTAWTDDQIPRPEPKSIPISRKGAALTEENQRWAEQQREERARRERNAAVRLKRLAERDAEIEARMAGMDEDERRYFMETLASTPTPTTR